MSRVKRIILILFIVIAGFVGCNKKSNVITSFPRDLTLYIAGFQWEEPSNFNPLNDRPDWPLSSNVTLVYEPLFAYNDLSGVLEPLLGKDYEMFDSTLTITLTDSATWSDGNRVTNADVLYTFYLHNRYNTKHHGGWQYFDSLFIDKDSNIVFKLNRAEYNPLVIKDIITNVEILPQHIFAPLEDEAIEEFSKLPEGENKKSKILDRIQNFVNGKDIVASGPYTLYSYSNEKIVLKRVDAYWGNKVNHSGKKAVPQYIIHPIYKSNSNYNLALAQGNIDVSATFCPMVWNKKKDGVGTWFDEEPYYIPGSIPSLIISQKPQLSKKDKSENLTKMGLVDKNFRRACAMSIDRSMIRKIAMQGYAPELSPGYILNYGVEQMYFSRDVADSFGVKYDLEGAKELLKNSGYKMGEDSILIAPNGKKLAELKMVCPAGWSDWNTSIKIAVQGLRKLGIPVRESFIEEGAYWDKLGMGYFDFIMKTPKAESVPSLPWSRFEEAISSDGVEPIGEYIYANEGRYYNRKADSLINIIPKLTNDDDIMVAYSELNKLFMIEMPVIPLMYRPVNFYQFSTKYWTGYPTDKNPYAPPQCLSVGAGVKALWELKPAHKKVEG